MLYTAIIPAVKSLSYQNGMLIGNTDVKKVKVSSLMQEEYKIVIKDGITVYASTDKGFFYAEKTLKQIFAQYGDCIPNMTIEDTPKYGYRSFMIDSCRHFFSVTAIKKMIDLCSDFKFNKFHWHISDDQGWRVQIDKYPALTEKASVRHGTALGQEVTFGDYGGYYTKDDVREVVAYAAERFIDVIPEIDVPGHTSALLSVFPELGCDGASVEVKRTAGIFRDVLCVSNEKTYEVIFNIFDELCELFPSEYFHIGGDEAPKYKWKRCPGCQDMIKKESLKDEEELHCFFVNKIIAYLKAKGKKAISWNDSLKGGMLDPEAVVQVWMEKNGASAQSMNKLIASDFYNYYMDYPYTMTPLKKTYEYNEKINLNVIGVETPIWTEYIPSFEKMLYMCFPRFIAVAQTGWSVNKPPYKKFEKDLLTIMKGYDTSCWGKPEEWNPNAVNRGIGTAGFFINKLNPEFKKQLLEDRKIAKEENK